MVLSAPTFEQSALLLAWVAILLLAFALSGLMRHVYALHKSIHGGRSATAGPPAGMTAPHHPALRTDRHSLLLFADPSCDACDGAITAIADAHKRGPDNMQYAVLYRGTAPNAHGPAGLAVIPDVPDLFSALNIAVTPTAVLLDERRRVIASAPVGSTRALTEFMAFTTQEGGRR
jgi:hypothetical protein